MESKDDGSWLLEMAKSIEKISELKKKMKDRGLWRAKANCPKCGGRDTLQLALAPSKRLGGAVRWRCEADGCAFAGME